MCVLVVYTQMQHAGPVLFFYFYCNLYDWHFDLIIIIIIMRICCSIRLNLRSIESLRVTSYMRERHVYNSIYYPSENWMSDFVAHAKPFYETNFCAVVRAVHFSVLSSMLCCVHAFHLKFSFFFYINFRLHQNGECIQVVRAHMFGVFYLYIPIVRCRSPPSNLE